MLSIFQQYHFISGTKERHKYTGHELDNQTGYTYAKARYLNTDTGRFSSEDPMFWRLSKQLLVEPQLQNSYSYAGNNPIRYMDPTGGARTDYVQIPLAPGVINTNTIYPENSIMGYYKGVPLYAGAGAPNYDGAIFTQCVEGVKRIYDQGFFENIDTQYGTAFNMMDRISKSFSNNFESRYQGNSSMPQENDILVYGDMNNESGNPGHVSVIAEVEFNSKTNSGSIWTIDQNRSQITNLFKHTFEKRDGGFYINGFGSGQYQKEVIGWQHPTNPGLDVSPNISGQSVLNQAFNILGSTLKGIGDLFRK